MDIILLDKFDWRIKVRKRLRDRDRKIIIYIKIPKRYRQLTELASNLYMYIFIFV